MWKCQQCGLPVYFAERRQSLGYDWHPNCLRCEECAKILTPGTHAEHKGVPYCHIPCYAALFGPKLFGHGSTTESHRSFGRRENSFIREQNVLKTRVEDYNKFYNKVSKNQISYREVNGRFILEGIIKIYWGTEASVRLKEYDDTRLIRQRKTLSVAADFVNVQDEDKEALEEDEEDCNSSSLPYFNPRTHPLFRESIGELNKTTTDPFYDQLLDKEILQDVENDNLLSYDPIQKWKTLQSLVDSSDSSDNNTGVDEPEVSVDVKPSEKLVRSSSVTHENNPQEKCVLMKKKKSSTLPSRLTEIRDDLDDLLQVERKIEDHERVYHTVHSKLPVGEDEKDEHKEKTTINHVIPSVESQHTEQSKTGRIFTVEKLKEETTTLQTEDNQDRKPSKSTIKNEPSDDQVKVRSKGPRALRRRHGKKMDKTKLKRRSSINGHWYDRDTSVFTPPKHTPMCVYTSSKMSSSEVVTTLLDKYKIESEPGHYALYLVKETGETRLVQDTEFPLLLRVNMGPHEDISKLYLMDKNRTSEISNEVAQFLNFSKTELRSFLNMFYEEEEREADRIRTKYLVISRRLQYAMRLKQGQGQVF